MSQICGVIVIGVALVMCLLSVGCRSTNDGSRAEGVIIVKMAHAGREIIEIKNRLESAKNGDTVELLVTTLPERMGFLELSTFVISITDFVVTKGCVRFETADGFIVAYPNNQYTIGLNGRPERKYASETSSIMVYPSPPGPPAIVVEKLTDESLAQYGSWDSNQDYRSQRLETRVIDGKKCFKIRVWKSPDFEGSISTWKIFPLL